MESQKPQNTQSLYEHYINTCIKYGIDKDIIQDFMDYQTLTDFIISNTDEHLMNFGVLRNAKTLESYIVLVQHLFLTLETQCFIMMTGFNLDHVLTFRIIRKTNYKFL